MEAYRAVLSGRGFRTVLFAFFCLILCMETGVAAEQGVLPDRSGSARQTILAAGTGPREGKLLLDENSGMVYGELLKKHLESAGLHYQIDRQQEHLEERFQQGAEGIELLDVQAVPYLNSKGKRFYWSPHYQGTVVLFIKDGWAEQIKGWADLLSHPVTVSLVTKEPYQECFALAMDYGLARTVNGQTALQALKQLRQEKRLLPDVSWGDDHFPMEKAPDADVRILFDYQTIQPRYRTEGRVSVIPKDGTLTFSRGILSRNPFPPATDQLRLAMEQAGYTHDKPYYAATVQNMQEFQKDAFLLRRHIFREIYGIHRNMPLGSFEITVIYVALMILTILGGGSIYFRFIQKGVRKAVGCFLSLLVLWQVCRLVHLWIPYDQIDLMRWFHYLNYVFRMALATCLLWLAESSGKDVSDREMPRMIRILFAVDILLGVFVLLNDWHRWIASCDGGFYRYHFTHRYEPGMYIIFCFLALQSGGALIRLYGNVWRQKLLVVSAFYPLLMFVCYVLYNYSCLQGGQMTQQAELPAVFVLLSLGLLHSLLKSGLLISNREYEDFFRYSDLGMRILDNTGKAIYTSLKNPTRLMGDIERSSRPIDGGTVTWYRNISELQRTRCELQLAVETAERMYHLLKAQETIRRQYLDLELQRQLYMELERVIASKRGPLRQYGMQLQTIAPGPEAYSLIRRLNIVASYLKKRCVLLLRGKENYLLQTDEFHLALTETLSYVQEAGLRCALNFRVQKAEIPTALALALYDVFDHVMEFLVNAGEKSVLLSFSDRNGWQAVWIFEEEKEWMETEYQALLRQFGGKQLKIRLEKTDYGVVLECRAL